VNCELTHELAPDLALGILDGEQRAQLLEHLETCPACADLVADYGTVVDRLLLLAPAIDPPAGFETKVLSKTRRKRPYAWFGAIAAAAVLLIGGTFMYENRGSTNPYVTVGGNEMRFAALKSASGAQWGQAFVYEGKNSWVFVSMQWDVPNGTYAIVLDRTGGEPSMTVNGLHLTNGQGSFGHTVGATTDVTDVRVVDAQGQTVCKAILTT
jgi:hypothetical protein